MDRSLECPLYTSLTVFYIFSGPLSSGTVLTSRSKLIALHTLYSTQMKCHSVSKTAACIYVYFDYCHDVKPLVATSVDSVPSPNLVRITIAPIGTTFGNLQ